MRWKAIRLELASSGDFPRGSVARSYLLRLPLDQDGQIHVHDLEADPARATVRRFWPNQADMIGQVVRTPSGYAIRYESGRDVPADLFRISADTIRIGDQVMMTELDGRELPFQVAGLR